MSDFEISGNDMILLSSRSIGDIEIGVMLSEDYTDSIEITDHPVHRGASVSDHAYRKPCQLTLSCGWSNADYSALKGHSQRRVDNGVATSAEYVNSIYSYLLNLQTSREPFEVVTSRRRYRNMLIQALAVTHDRTQTGALKVKATLREVIIVETRRGVFPDAEDQKEPTSTAQTQEAGKRGMVPRDPSPGGALPVPQS